MKRSAIKRGTTGIKRTRGSYTPGTVEQKLHFKTQTLQRNRGCVVRDDGKHQGPLQAHHVTSKEAIKSWYSRSKTLTPLDALLWDPRNGLTVCRRHHDRHTLARCRIPRRAVHAEAVAFARALGLEHLLDRYYRGGGERNAETA